MRRVTWELRDETWLLTKKENTSCALYNKHVHHWYSDRPFSRRRRRVHNVSGWKSDVYLYIYTMIHRLDFWSAFFSNVLYIWCSLEEHFYSRGNVKWTYYGMHYLLLAIPVPRSIHVSCLDIYFVHVVNIIEVHTLVRASFAGSEIRRDILAKILAGRFDCCRSSRFL